MIMLYVYPRNHSLWRRLEYLHGCQQIFDKKHFMVFVNLYEYFSGGFVSELLIGYGSGYITETNKQTLLLEL